MFRWKKIEVEDQSFNKDRLLMTLAEKFKYDVESVAFDDSKAKNMANEILYHFAWKVLEKERDGYQNDT